MTRMWVPENHSEPPASSSSSSSSMPPSTPSNATSRARRAGSKKSLKDGGPAENPAANDGPTNPPAFVPKYFCRACDEVFPNWSQCLSHVRAAEAENDRELHAYTTSPEGRRELQKICKYVNKENKPPPGAAHTQPSSESTNTNNNNNNNNNNNTKKKRAQGPRAAPSGTGPEPQLSPSPSPRGRQSPDDGLETVHGTQAAGSAASVTPAGNVAAGGGQGTEKRALIQVKARPNFVAAAGAAGGSGTSTLWGVGGQHQQDTPLPPPPPQPSPPPTISTVRSPAAARTTAVSVGSSAGPPSSSRSLASSNTRRFGALVRPPTPSAAAPGGLTLSGAGAGLVPTTSKRISTSSSAFSLFGTGGHEFLRGSNVAMPPAPSPHSVQSNSTSFGEVEDWVSVSSYSSLSISPHSTPQSSPVGSVAPSLEAGIDLPGVSEQHKLLQMHVPAHHHHHHHHHRHLHGAHGSSAGSRAPPGDAALKSLGGFSGRNASAAAVKFKRQPPPGLVMPPTPSSAPHDSWRSPSTVSSSISASPSTTSGATESYLHPNPNPNHQLRRTPPPGFRPQSTPSSSLSGRINSTGGRGGSVPAGIEQHGQLVRLPAYLSEAVCSFLDVEDCAALLKALYESKRLV